MNSPVNQSRRKFLKIAGSGLLVGALPPRLFGAETPRFSRRPNPAFKPDVEIGLSARESRIQILPGSLTPVWKYHARVLKGDRRAVEVIRQSYLGPVFRVEQGQKVRILFTNELPEMCVTHWHGLHVPANMDGHPMDAVNTGETLVYEFEVLNRAGTYWFHPHTHELTATQVYWGLAGLFIVTDKAEKGLNLPSGEFDVPLVLQDRTFDADNQFRYLDHRMQTMTGFLGDRIMINGRPDFVLDAAARSYRLRLINGSNSRIYKLAWQDGTPLTVIGTDGGLLEKPDTRAFVMLAPGERIELWADFSGRKKGSEMILRSRTFAGLGHGMHRGMGGGMGHHGMGRGMMGGMMGRMMQSALPLGSDYPVLKVRIVRNAPENSILPGRLTPIRRLQVKDAANAENPRPIAVSMTHMSPQLNGRSYEMDNILDSERIPLNSLQLIDIRHAHSGGMGMGMMNVPHPIHLHGQQFQVVGRSIDSAHSADYDTVKAGFVDSGWKDTVLVMPGESVRILKPFEDFAGRFMVHCHNLEHEDAGMMRDFWVA